MKCLQANCTHCYSQAALQKYNYLPACSRLFVTIFQATFYYLASGKSNRIFINIVRIHSVDK